MVLPTMYRATQNPDTPNLPFAQTTSPTMFRDMQNPDTPNLPFAQTSYSFRGGTQKYPTTGGWNTGLEKQGVTVPPTSSSGYSRTQIEKIIEDYHGDDISLLHSHAVDFGKSLSSAKLHRDSIEGKVETGITARKDIHTKLTGLGKSVSDVSSALDIHKAEFDIHKQHDLIPNPLGDILPYILIGGVALLAMSGRKSRKR
jgi:hypothetical protein